MKLWKYIKDYRLPATAGFLFKIIEAALELAFPLVMADIIDHGIKKQNIDYVYQQGMVLLGLGIVGYLCALVCQYYASKTSQSVGTALRKDMYHHINTYEYQNLDTLSAPSLVTRITNDVVQIQLAIAMSIRLTSRAPFLIIGSLVMAFTISGSLSSIFLLGAFVLAIIMGVITVRSMPYFTKIQKKLDQISLVARENLNGVRVIRAFSKQKNEIARFKKQTRQQKDLQVNVGKIQALLNPLTYSIVNLAIIFIVYNGGLQVNVGKLSQGEVIALVNYMNQILLALIVFTNVLTIYNKAAASYKRVIEVVDTVPSIKDTGTSLQWQHHEEAIVFNHVSFSYHNKHVLKDLNFVIKKGETVGIIGGTGAGKTTLVNLIGRFYDVSVGSIFIDGHPIESFSLQQLRGYIGYVPQNASLISGTIKENMQLGNRSASDEDIYKSLEIAQAREFVDALPQGLDTKIVQGGKNLSGGQKQRLTIARAIVKQPRILILDNSDSALDFVTSAALRKALQTLTNTTTIIVSQRTYAIAHADHILVLFHGDFVGHDTHENLLQNCLLYQEIYSSQQTKEDK